MIYTLVRQGRWLVLGMFMISVLGGCSVSFGYRYLDVLIAWQVDDYVTWDTQQSPIFKSRVRELIQWHQSTQLLQYVGYLEGIKSDLNSPLTDEQLSEYQHQVSDFYRVILDEAYPESIDLLASLSDQQVDEFSDGLLKQYRELDEKYVSGDLQKIEKARVKRLTKTIKRWIGGLTKEQKKMVTEWNENYQNANKDWLEGRRQWDEDWMAALRERRAPEFDARLKALFFVGDRYQTDAYKSAMQSNTQNAYQLIRRLQSSLTQHQKNHLDKELNKWIRQFDRLAAKAPQKPERA